VCCCRWHGQVFQLSLAALRHLSAASPPADDKLKEQAVQLALGTLSFDFVGTCLDESTEDLGTIQARPDSPDRQTCTARSPMAMRTDAGW
jgi:hypothetical protein